MFIMLNIFSLNCIWLNSIISSSSFFFAKLCEAYAFLNPNVDFENIICILSIYIYIYIYIICKLILYIINHVIT